MRESAEQRVSVGGRWEPEEEMGRGPWGHSTHSAVGKKNEPPGLPSRPRKMKLVSAVKLCRIAT